MSTIEPPPTPASHGMGAASHWVQRWSHLVPPGGTVLDIACGHGRHMNWFAQRGHPVIGIDQSPEAVQTASNFGETVLADIENKAWPLITGSQVRRFEAVIVTNYLWRPLFPVIAQSVAPAGLLIYETFAQGNETVGKPSRPDFLLQPAELLCAFGHMHIIAFEDGFLENPPRFVQRITAISPASGDTGQQIPSRYAL